MSTRSPPELPAGWLLFTDSRNAEEPLNIPIWDTDILKVGRDPLSNSFAIPPDKGNMVSRNHCEFYVVVYDATMNHVYVRDRRSFNGTFVNRRLIGKAEENAPGYLLSDGDIVEIRPYWQFVYRQVWSSPHNPLTPLQVEECKLFATRYQVLSRTLGNGAEAVAHLAVDTATRRQLVCKLVNLQRPSQRKPRENLRCVLQEADVLRQLQHPNILPYVDAICSPHTLYTFTELASGGDLCSFIRRHKSVPELDARIILRQITRALRFLHDKGIIHRDLKPENVLLALSPRITYQRVLLSDFGACVVPRRNRMITCVGTYEYQAPEMRLREKQTAVVDTWSLGVIAIALITGEASISDTIRHMDQKATTNAIYQHLSKEALPLSPQAHAFINGCLQIRPDERFTSAQADRHAWLCSPKRHVDFFEELDQRMFMQWKVEKRLRPMPIELPDLMKTTSQPPFAEGEVKSDECEPVNNPVAVTEASKHFPVQNLFCKPHGKMTGSGNTLITQQEAVSRTLSNGVKKDVISQIQKQTASINKKRILRIKRANLRVPDSLLLPLTGLQRHLAARPNKDGRAELIEQLGKSQAKFLDV